MQLIEDIIFKKTTGLASRGRNLLYSFLGMKKGDRNRFEKGRCRRFNQIAIGNNNAFTAGFMLWPLEEAFDGIRIKIGDNNYFNRNAMIDSCGSIDIGNNNLFGPDVYITDSDHTFGLGISPSNAPMERGHVKIGNHCWIGAKVTILKNVQLGDYCVVAAGAVVTKSFPLGSIIGGVPAKELRNKTVPEKIIK